MDYRHRYFAIAHSSDAKLTSYCARLSLIAHLWVLMDKAYVLGVGLLIPLWLTYMGGAALVTSHFDIGRLLMTSSLYFAGVDIGGLIASAVALVIWKRLIPVPGNAALVAPLEPESKELADMRDAGTTHSVCGAYLRTVEEQGRKLYQFDANYIAELAEVLKRGEWPQAYATLALRN